MQSLRIVYILTLVFLGVTLASAQGSVASAKDTAKTKEKITKWGEGSDVTVNLLEGKTLHGSITKINADSFTIDEVDLRAKVDVRFDQVKKIEKGFTKPGALTGHRVSPKTRKIATISLIAGFGALIVIILASLKD